MTIKKRLFISNILMILAPVAITLLIGLACIGSIWFIVTHESVFGFEDSEDFYQVSQQLALLVEHRLLEATEDQGEKLKDLGKLLENQSISLVVQSNDEDIYAYGNRSVHDPTLIDAVSEMKGEGLVRNQGRVLYMKPIEIDGDTFRILISGNQTEISYDSLTVVLAFTAIVLIFTIFLAILLTNRFLVKFVFQRIEEPLLILSNGVHQIMDGNLGHRIEYSQVDEFAPVCSDFNEMAVRLKQSVVLSQKQDQSRKELLAGISHDLRTPLTTIRAYVEGLQDGIPKTPEAKDAYLQTIRMKTEEITQMVSMLFVFSKMELGEYEGHPELLQLDDEIIQLVLAIAQEYKEKGLVILTDQLLSAKVFADPDQLRRVLMNIFENSLKYKEKAEGTLVISLTKKRNKYLLSLCDDGPGVPVESLPHLFEAFYRSDPARQNSFEGSGLGLAIAAKIIGQMQGEILARNVETGGLEIMVLLPEVEG